MHLINAKDFYEKGILNREVFYESIPPYAILSHTWGREDEKSHIWGHFDEEISFSDFSKAEIVASKGGGYDKIVRSCNEAYGRGLHYVWIDTCCIDQSSSAELTYGINSMFHWYRNAEVCMVYLADTHGSLRNQKREPSRWFDRGWTLQELIAPRHAVFFDSKWIRLGTRDDDYFSVEIKEITGIEREAFGDPELVRYSTSQKLAWAAKRHTRRPEDRAYSLLGIFGIHMPLLYGEGEKGAFRRLQLEIIKETSDLSILAWEPEKQSDNNSVLAESPLQFAASGNIGRSLTGDHYTLTNKGIQMTSTLWKEPYMPNPNLPSIKRESLLLLLGRRGREGSCVCIRLRKIAQGVLQRTGPMVDVNVQNLSSTHSSTFYIAMNPREYDCIPGTPRAGSIFVPDFYKIRDVVPEAAWNYDERFFFNHPHWRGGNALRALHLELYIEGPAVRLGVLINLTKDPPQCLSFDIDTDRRRNPSISDRIFNRRRRTSSTSWGDLETEVPEVKQLTNQTTVYNQIVTIELVRSPPNNSYTYVLYASNRPVNSQTGLSNALPRAQGLQTLPSAQPARPMQLPAPHASRSSSAVFAIPAITHLPIAGQVPRVSAPPMVHPYLNHGPPPLPRQVVASNQPTAGFAPPVINAGKVANAPWEAPNSGQSQR